LDLDLEEITGRGVHFEADVKDKSGAVAHVVADGKIEDVTNARRSIVGTWTQGSVKGDFKVIRDNWKFPGILRP
jgi:hypothetical protein